MSSHCTTLEPDVSKFKAPHKEVVYNDAYHLGRKPTWDIQGRINKKRFKSYTYLYREREFLSDPMYFWQTRLWSTVAISSLEDCRLLFFYNMSIVFEDFLK